MRELVACTIQRTPPPPAPSPSFCPARLLRALSIVPHPLLTHPPRFVARGCYARFPAYPTPSCPIPRILSRELVERGIQHTPPLLPHPFSFCNASLLCALSSVPKDEKLETNWYCHNVRNLENHAPLLCAVCDLQFLLPSNEKTSKTMHQCPALPATFNSYYHQMRKPRDHAPLLRAACDLQLLQPFNVKTLENEPLLRAACDLQLLLPSNDKTSKTMNHCSALPATFNSY